MHKNIQVIIYGRIHQDWKESFYPDSKIWESFPEVTSVIHSEMHFPAANSLYDKQVVIPMFIKDSKTCPIGYFSLIPPIKSIEICDNKKKFIDFLIENNLSDYCSKQYTQETIEYPAIIKTTSDSGGVGIKILHNEEDLLRNINSEEYLGKEYYLEEYIYGDMEHVVNVICKGGKILYSFGHQYHRSIKYYVKHGVQGSRSLYTPPKEFMDIFEHIMKLLNFSGPANFGYKVQDGKPKIFEVNPRFGSGLVVPKEHKEALIESVRTVIENSTFKN